MCWFIRVPNTRMSGRCCENMNMTLGVQCCIYAFCGALVRRLLSVRAVAVKVARLIHFIFGATFLLDDMAFDGDLSRALL